MNTDQPSTSIPLVAILARYRTTITAHNLEAKNEQTYQSGNSSALG